MCSNKMILLDIEGTITSKSFVTSVLFPYAQKNLKEFLDSHWTDDELQQDIDALRHQAETDINDGIADCVAISKVNSDNSNVNDVKQEIIKNVEWQMKLDRKTSSLKSLQGKVWKHGFESKQIVGHVYLDAVDAIKKWISEGKKVMIYSSGSVAAQKLLFTYSEHGDLTPYFHAHFDTKVGPKKEKSSYENIANICQAKTSDFTFFTDDIDEANASISAGMNTVLVRRLEDSENSTVPVENIRTIENFKEEISSDKMPVQMNDTKTGSL